MMSKKFLLSSLVTVLLAVGVAFYACSDNNDLTPAEDGMNLAAELCDCFTKAESDNAKLECISRFESKRNRWRDGADREAFDAAYKEAIASCPNDPYQWKLSHLATIAAAEFCALAAQHPEGGSMMDLAPLYSKYEAELNSNDPVFLQPFFGGLMACSPNSDWILCTFGMTNFCPEIELTDEQLVALAVEAAPKFCQYFTENPEADMNSMLTSSLAQYASYFAKSAFTGALLQGLMSSCSSTPQWFICTMTGGQALGCN